MIGLKYLKVDLEIVVLFCVFQLIFEVIVHVLLWLSTKLFEINTACNII